MTCYQFRSSWRLRPTSRKHDNACNRDDKDDEKFGGGEDILHVVRQRDTQTVHCDDQHWKKAAVGTVLDITKEVQRN